MYRFVPFFLISHNRAVGKRCVVQHSPSVKFNRGLIHKKKSKEKNTERKRAFTFRVDLSNAT